MLNLCLVLQLVIDGFNDAPPSEHQLIHKREKPVLHVPPYTGDELGTLLPEFIYQLSYTDGGKEE